MTCSKLRLEWNGWSMVITILNCSMLLSKLGESETMFILTWGTVTNDRDAIGKATIEYYIDLFDGHVEPPPHAVFRVIQLVVTSVDNEALCSIRSHEEVRNEISEMALDSSPRSDGFTGRFYVYFWEVIKVDLMAAVIGFFEGLHLPRSFSSTYLTMIPKVAIDTSIS
ncbi:hypothetical protein QQ045_033625 [Rhodiola kirilowii]